MANQIMKDTHLDYISTPVSSCVNEFISVDFEPSSGKQTDFYCDPKNEKYIRVSGISDDVCTHLLKMESDNEVEMYAYDEYTRPLCDKGDNAFIFAFADTGFPAIACESIADYPPDFYGICHEMDKLCLKCSDVQMPNATQTQCVNLQCDEVTETLCATQKAKWCCPNTELCGTTAGVCVKSDGMCSAIFSEPKVSKTYDCAYKMVAHTRSAGLETIDLEEVKACANLALYCNLTYADDSCSTTATAGTPIGTTLYGTCAPMNTSYTGCTSVIDSSTTIQEIKQCPSSQYCHLKYTDEQCTAASASAQDLLFGVCLAMNSSNALCPPVSDK